MNPLRKSSDTETVGARPDRAHTHRVIDACLTLALQALRTPIGIIKVQSAPENSLEAMTGIASDQAQRLGRVIEQTRAAGKVLIVSGMDENDEWKDCMPSRAGSPIQFYAGIPIKSADGSPCGVLAVLDYVPRRLAEHELMGLQNLADQIALQLTASEITQENSARAPASEALHPVAAFPTEDIRRTSPAVAGDDRRIQKLAYTNRVLHFITRCNEALIKGNDELDLLHIICKLAIDAGGYALALVNFAQQDAGKTLSPVAYASEHDASRYVASLQESCAKDCSTGQEPDGKTMRSGVPTIIEDVAANAGLTAWHVDAAKHGYRSVIALPLRAKDHVFGTLDLYMCQVVRIDPEEISLLQDLADNLAFRIHDIRARNDARRLQAAVHSLATSVSSGDTADFFEELVRNLVALVGAESGFAAKLVLEEQWIARTIHAVKADGVVGNFQCILSGSPYENLIKQDHWLVLDKPANTSLISRLFSTFSAQKFVGRRLDNAAGQPIGILAVLFREPPKQLDFVMSAMHIFSVRAAAELERREADARIHAQASLLDKAQDAIIVCCLDYRITYWNKSAERLYGWSAEEVIGKNLLEVFGGDPAFFENASNSVLEHADWRGELPQHRKDGSLLTVEAHWTLINDEESGAQSILAIHTDITQRKKTEAKIHHLAFYDQLTGLPNRMFLYDRLRHALASTNRSGHRCALMFIDLDNFKTLNDTLGHDIGDLLLQQVSLRLSSCVRETDTAARLGGDEFVVLLEELSDSLDEAALQAKSAGEKIIAALNKPFQLAGYEHSSTCSVGVTVFQGREDSADDILKRADLAMYQAKCGGRNAICFFDPQMQQTVTQKLTLEADLRNASRANEFRLLFQPQVDGEGKTVGVEALIRWQQPKRGAVSPAEFIPLAEETGLILSVGRWVLETACRQLKEWEDDPAMARINIAVNVSARQFHHPQFVDEVRTVLNKTGADPSRLKLELTESIMVEDIDATVEKMMTLKAEGISFSLDDFGTGYSSLSYLKRLPLDQLKIDQSFVRDVLTDPNDAVIARTIVALGQSLGLDVIAEGVETAEQRDFLANNGCHTYQGYFFSQPLPADQIH